MNFKIVTTMRNFTIMKTKNVTLVTPVGTAQYPWLNKADTHFNENGVYHVDMIFSSQEEVQEFINKAEEVRDAYFDDLCEKDAKKKRFIKTDIGEELDDGEGFKIKFKSNASFVGKDGNVIKVKIPLFDGTGKPCPKAKIGSGSQIRVSCQVIPYANPASKTVGVSFRLQGVQVVQIVEWGGQSASALGFGAVEGGYSYDESSYEDDYEEEETTEEAVEAKGDF